MLPNKIKFLLTVALLFVCYRFLSNPFYFLLISQNAEKYMYKEEWEKAFYLYKSLQKYYPQDASITKKLGDILAIKNSYTDAIYYYEKSLQNSQNTSISSEIYHNLGNIFLKKGNFDKATQLYNLSLQIQETDETKKNLEISYTYSSSSPKKQKNNNSYSPQKEQQQLTPQKMKISKSEAENILQSIEDKSDKNRPIVKSTSPIRGGVSLDKNW